MVCGVPKGEMYTILPPQSQVCAEKGWKATFFVLSWVVHRGGKVHGILGEGERDQEEN